MKKIFLPVIFAGLVLLLGVSAGCTVDKVVKTDLGQEFSLGIGQTALIQSEQLAVRFDGIAGDSRCPSGVTCIWAGEVSSNVTVTYQGSPSNITLTQSGAEQSTEAVYKQYALIFSVEPYPQAGKQISDADYRLNLTVEK